MAGQGRVEQARARLALLIGSSQAGVCDRATLERLLSEHLDLPRLQLVVLDTMAEPAVSAKAPAVAAALGSDADGVVDTAGHRRHLKR